MIELHGLTKRYGSTLAVDDLSFSVQPGIVTGFLGPNGAGKSTTMRLMVGLDRPTSGTVTINGKPYADHRAPLHEVGALLEARSVHTGRKAYDHLLALARTHGIPKRRVDEVVDLVGLHDVARKRAGGFSLGMGQRLGIASALLGDPSVVLLDEPVNGLDVEGIRWVRELLRTLAQQGRTVFLSSHLMSEMAQTADHVIVVGRGRLIADTTTAALLAGASTGVVIVRSPHPGLGDALTAKGGSVSRVDHALQVTGLTAEQVGETALAAGAVLHELRVVQTSLEEAYVEMTRDAVEFSAGGAA